MAEDDKKKVTSENGEPDPSTDPALLAEREEGEDEQDKQSGDSSGQERPGADPSIAAVHTGSRSSSEQTAAENEARVDLVGEQEIESEGEEEQRQSEEARQLQLDQVEQDLEETNVQGPEAGRGRSAAEGDLDIAGIEVGEAAQSAAQGGSDLPGAGGEQSLFAGLDQSEERAEEEVAANEEVAAEEEAEEKQAQSEAEDEDKNEGKAQDQSNDDQGQTQNQPATASSTEAPAGPSQDTSQSANTAPLSVELLDNTVDENADGAVVGKLNVIDLDAGDTFSFNVSDDRFEVVNGDLKLKEGVTLDHELIDQIDLEVTVTDSSGNVITQSFTVDVNDVNEAPTNLALDNASVDENADGAIVGTLTASDPDAGDSLSYTVSDARFEVVDGDLKLKDGVTLDHEEAASIDVTVTATDAGGLTTAESFTITVNDVNEAPTNLALDNASVDENADGAIVGTLTATDPDAGDSLSYTVSDARFEVVDGDLKLKDGVTLDHEEAASIDVTVTATDAGGLTTAESFTITVNDVNEPPVNEAPTDIELSNTTIEEDEEGVVIGTISVVDPDDTSFTYAVSDDRFEVVDGQLKLKDDVEVDDDDGPVSIDITATDPAGNSYTETFSLSVTDDDDDDDDDQDEDGDGNRGHGNDEDGYDNDNPGRSEKRAEGDEDTEGLTIDGTSGNNTLRGGEGDDTIDGGRGDDVLYGEGGDDVMVGGAGDDVMVGGGGDDLFMIGARDGTDLISGGEGTDTIQLSDSGDWTLILDDGSAVEAAGDGYMALSEESAGTIVFDDGTEVSFDGIEKISWGG